MDTKRLEIFDRERQLILVARRIDSKDDRIYAEITKGLRPPSIGPDFKKITDIQIVDSSLTFKMK